MSLAGRGVRVLLMAAMVASAAACTSGSDTSDETASCAYQVTYKGRTYRDVANVDFTVGDKLGTATKPPCDDTGGQDEDPEPATTRTAYAVNGISPEVAIAVGSTPDDAMFVAVYSDNKLPPEVRKLIKAS
ncbi:DUF6281 family protein [Streptomyces cinerochromogenes]|uniref:DUF6281 family protein n=1 Tax=Streptomyces cinerochromogenes TaxID=66422 RepID=A0ABW7B788_9ACTN